MVTVLGKKFSPFIIQVQHILSQNHENVHFNSTQDMIIVSFLIGLYSAEILSLAILVPLDLP